MSSTKDLLAGVSGAISGRVTRIVSTADTQSTVTNKNIKDNVVLLTLSPLKISSLQISLLLAHSQPFRLLYVKFGHLRRKSTTQKDAIVILDGLSITVMGMVIVFAFLIILVAVMRALHYGLHKLHSKSLAQESDQSDKTLAQENRLAVVAAAVAAVKDHMAVRGIRK